MKNYTAQFEFLKLEHAGQIEPGEVRLAVENILLRASPPVTFKLGTFVLAESNQILGEISTDAQKVSLAGMLKKLEVGLPLQVKEVGYGWLVTVKPVGETRLDSSRDPSADPFALVKEQAEPEKIYTYHPFQRLRFAISILLPMVFLLLILVNLLPAPWIGPLFQATANTISGFFYILTLFLFSLSEGFSLPWQITSKVRCDLLGLEVYHYYSRKPQRLEWSDIDHLEYRNLGWSVHSVNKTIHFQTPSVKGLIGQPELIKTITTRASLNFVEGGIERLTYKRFDAE